MNSSLNRTKNISSRTINVNESILNSSSLITKNNLKEPSKRINKMLLETRISNPNLKFHELSKDYSLKIKTYKKQKIRNLVDEYFNQFSLKLFHKNQKNLTPFQKMQLNKTNTNLHKCNREDKIKNVKIINSSSNGSNTSKNNLIKIYKKENLNNDKSNIDSSNYYTIEHDNYQTINNSFINNSKLFHISKGSNAKINFFQFKNLPSSVNYQTYFNEKHLLKLNMFKRKFQKEKILNTNCINTISGKSLNFINTRHSLEKNINKSNIINLSSISRSHFVRENISNIEEINSNRKGKFKNVKINVNLDNIKKEEELNDIDDDKFFNKDVNEYIIYNKIKKYKIISGKDNNIQMQYKTIN